MRQTSGSTMHQIHNIRFITSVLVVVDAIMKDQNELKRYIPCQGDHWTSKIMKGRLGEQPSAPDFHLGTNANWLSEKPKPVDLRTSLYRSLEKYYPLSSNSPFHLSLSSPHQTGLVFSGARCWFANKANLSPAPTDFHVGTYQKKKNTRHRLVACK